VNRRDAATDKPPTVAESEPIKGSSSLRRAEPITRRVAKNGTVSYEFRADIGTKPDGSRDRRRFTYPSLKQAQKELRRITTEVSAGTYAKASRMTVNEAIDQWLAGRRGIRKVSLEGYVDDLKPVRRVLGGKRLQQLTKADGDALVSWMLTEGRQSPRHYQPMSLAGRVSTMVAQHPGGITAADLAATFPGEDVHTCLANLKRAGRVSRVRRGVYIPVETGTDARPMGVGPVAVRATLTRFTAVVQSFTDQGVLPRNPIALVEPPTLKRVLPQSWTLAEALQFRQSVGEDRLFACWLASCYGLRRSEVCGLRWSDIDAQSTTLYIRQGRVTVIGGGSVVDEPKSQRSRRSLPMPTDLAEALYTLKARQKQEAVALGIPWSDDRFVAVREDGGPVRPGWYSKEFHRLRQRAGLRRIKLHALRNTSVSLMLDQGQPVHVVAAWHGHDPAVTLSIYADAKADELRAAGAKLFS
jgi:integrase